MWREYDPATLRFTLREEDLSFKNSRWGASALRQAEERLADARAAHIPDHRLAAEDEVAVPPAIDMLPAGLVGDRDLAFEDGGVFGEREGDLDLAPRRFEDACGDAAVPVADPGRDPGLSLQHP